MRILVRLLRGVHAVPAEVRHWMRYTARNGNAPPFCGPGPTGRLRPVVTTTNFRAAASCGRHKEGHVRVASEMRSRCARLVQSECPGGGSNFGGMETSSTYTNHYSELKGRCYALLDTLTTFTGSKAQPGKVIRTFRAV